MAQFRAVLIFLLFIIVALQSVSLRLEIPIEEIERPGESHEAPLLDSIMTEARLHLAAAVKSGEDPLLASQKFSAVALQVAREAYIEVTESMVLPPHALLAGGSGGRYEMGTYSDLEYVVVFQDVCERSNDMDSLSKVLTRFRHALNKRGILSDPINQPRASKGTVACSPATFVKEVLFSGNEVAISMTLESTFLAGEKSLVVQVHEEASKWLSKTIEEAIAQVPMKRSMKQRMLGSEARTVGDFLAFLINSWKLGSGHSFALRTLRDLEAEEVERQKMLEGGLEEKQLKHVRFNIKSVLYRPLQNLIFAQTLMAPRTGNDIAFNALTKLQWLRSSGKWSAELVNQVHDALTMAIRLRILAHAEAGEENDDACREQVFGEKPQKVFTESVPTATPAVFTIPSGFDQKLMQTVRVVECIASYYKARFEEASSDELNTAMLVPSTCAS